MQVYKFGGASIASPQRLQNLLPILQEAPKPLLVVVSALGKTTNALEDIVKAASNGLEEDAHNLAQVLEKQHLEYAGTLLTGTFLTKAKEALNVHFTELQWAIDDNNAENYDYLYDQIVCIGEMLSTTIFNFYLQQEGLLSQWVDARDIIRTDDTYRDARIDWDYTQKQVSALLKPMLAQGKIVIMQGFIGATDENNSVTLGREGSDYTAALMANMLDAENVTIWKDVAGFYNADPKDFPMAQKIDAITYHEVIELTYYGAQIIHPKTIKPLQNKNIPLYVKCFLDRTLAGTVVSNDFGSIAYPPMMVYKKDQVLVQFTTRDYSFITEENLSTLYSVFASLNIRINLIQNAAISFVACIDNREEKIQKLLQALEKDYRVLRNSNVQIITVRHYTPEALASILEDKSILLEQKTRQTIQLVVH